MDFVSPSMHGQPAHGQDQKKYSIRDYKPTKLWYERKEIIQHVALNTPKEQIDRRLVDTLEKISKEDPHLDVRSIARELVRSYKLGRDFSRAPSLQRLLKK